MNPAIPRPAAAALLDRRTKRLDSYAYKLDASGGRFGMDVPFADDPMDVDEANMAVWIPFASGVRRDGVGDLLDVTGIDTSRHRVNPVVLFDHGKTVSLPVGLSEEPSTREYMVQIDPMNRSARAKAFFYQGKGAFNTEGKPDYEHAVFCEQLFDLIVKRYVRAGSIGYQVVQATPMPPDYYSGTPQGLHLQKTLLLEVSAVVMPANADTVRKSLGLRRVAGRPMCEMLVKSLTPYAAPKKAQMGYEGRKSGRNLYLYDGPSPYREAGGTHVVREYADEADLVPPISVYEPSLPADFAAGMRYAGGTSAQGNAAAPARADSSRNDVGKDRAPNVIDRRVEKTPAYSARRTDDERQLIEGDKSGVIKSQKAVRRKYAAKATWREYDSVHPEEPPDPNTDMEPRGTRSHITVSPHPVHERGFSLRVEEAGRQPRRIGAWSAEDVMRQTAQRRASREDDRQEGIAPRESIDLDAAVDDLNRILEEDKSAGVKAIQDSEFELPEVQDPEATAQVGQGRVADVVSRVGGPDYPSHMYRVSDSREAAAEENWRRGNEILLSDFDEDEFNRMRDAQSPRRSNWASYAGPGKGVKASVGRERGGPIDWADDVMDGLDWGEAEAQQTELDEIDRQMDGLLGDSTDRQGQKAADGDDDANMVFYAEPREDGRLELGIYDDMTGNGMRGPPSAPEQARRRWAAARAATEEGYDPIRLEDDGTADYLNAADEGAVRQMQEVSRLPRVPESEYQTVDASGRVTDTVRKKYVKSVRMKYRAGRKNAPIKPYGPDESTTGRLTQRDRALTDSANTRRPRRPDSEPDPNSNVTPLPTDADDIWDRDWDPNTLVFDAETNEPISREGDDE
jgi:hypothetical protein